MKKIFVLVLSIIVLLNVCTFTMQAQDMPAAKVVALVNGDEAPVAGEKFYVSVYADEIQSEAFVSGQVDYSWSEDAASLVEFYESEIIKVDDATWAVGNVYDEYSGRTGKFSQITNADIKNGIGSTAIYIDLLAKDQDASHVSGLKMFEIAFVLNDNYTFDDFSFEIDKTVLYLDYDKSVYYDSTVDNIEIEDIEENSSSDFDDVLPSDDIPTASVTARLVGDKTPAPGEKFYVALDVTDISSSKFVSGQIDFTWDSNVASTVDYYEDEPTVVTDRYCAGNIFDELVGRTGKFSSVLNFDNAGEVSVAIYIDLKAKDQEASDVEEFTMCEIAFVLNEGYSFDDFDFSITDAVLFLHEDKSTFSQSSTGEIDIINFSSGNTDKEVTVDGITYKLSGRNLFGGYDELTKADNGEKLEWEVVDEYVHLIGEPTGVSGSNTMRTFFKVDGGKTYYVSNSIYNKLSSSVDIKSAVVATKNTVFGRLAGLSAYSDAVYGGITSWTGENSAITILGESTSPADVTALSGNSKVEYIINVPEDAEYIMISYGAYGSEDVYYGDFEVYEAVIKTYTYKFVDEDGTVLKEVEAEYGAEIIAPAVPEKADTAKYDYTFAGWTGYTEGMTLTSDVTFTAKYDAVVKKYTYKFVDEDGTVLKEATAEYGTKIVAPAAPEKADTAKYDYTFAGWTGYTEGMTVTGDVTFTAAYNEAVKKYTYKFVDEDGTVLKETTAEYGTKIVAPTVPEKADTAKYDYTFANWTGYTEGMTLISDVTFTAKYDAVVKKYTYKFVDEDGTVLKEATAEYGTKIVAPTAPVKEDTAKYDYTFAGWTGYAEGMTVTDDVTFAATYDVTVQKYTYKFVDEDGTVIKEDVVDYGTEIVAPDSPVKEYDNTYIYTFAKWENYSEGMTVTEDVEFTAIYDATLHEPHTETVVTDGKATVELYNIKMGSIVIIKLYDNDDNVNTRVFVVDDTRIELENTSKYKNAKIMVWESLSSLKPVCVYETVVK